MSIKSINTSTTNYSGNAMTPSWINKHPVDRLLARTTRRQINLCNTNIRKKITLLVTHIRLSLSNKLGERRTAQKWELCVVSTTFLMELTMWKKESVWIVLNRKKIFFFFKLNFRNWRKWKVGTNRWSRRGRNRGGWPNLYWCPTKWRRCRRPCKL